MENQLLTDEVEGQEGGEEKNLKNKLTPTEIHVPHCVFVRATKLFDITLTTNSKNQSFLCNIYAISVYFSKKIAIVFNVVGNVYCFQHVCGLITSQ